MSRKRLEDMKKYIHFADNNNLPAGEKLAEIQLDYKNWIEINAKNQTNKNKFGLFETNREQSQTKIKTIINTRVLSKNIYKCE